MSVRLAVLKGSFVLTFAEGVAYGAAFVRNMILARLLSKGDFGVAAAFALMISMLEFASKLAVAQLVVQDKEGDRPDFIATAHFLQFLAAAVSSLLMLGAAGFLAQALHQSDKIWAFRSLALLPLFKGIEHLDVRRFGRDLRFVPASLVEAIPQVAITLAAWPLGLWLGDYRVILVLLVVKGSLTVVASHWLAQEPYRWKIKRTYCQRMWRFGWPLIINSLIMVGIYQGDQFMVGRYYSMGELGAYSAASALTLAPGMIFMQVMGAIMLPLLSKDQDDREKFYRRYRLCVQTVAAFSAFYAFSVIVGAESMMVIVFGKKYVGFGPVLGWLAAANALRMFRGAPTLAALARADSRNQMITNVLRSLGLLPALWMATHHHPVWGLAAAGFAGEIFAVWGSLARLARLDGVPWAWSLWPVGSVLLTYAVAGLVVQSGVYSWSWLRAISLALAGATINVALIVWRSRELKGEMVLGLAEAKRRLGSARFVANPRTV